MTQCRPLASLPSLTPTSLNRLQMFCCCSNSWIAASCSLWASVSLGLFSSRPARKTTIKKNKIILHERLVSKRFYYLRVQCWRWVQLSNSPRRLDRVLFWDTDSHVALRDISLSLSADKTPSQNLHSVIAGKINRLKSHFLAFTVGKISVLVQAFLHVSRACRSSLSLVRTAANQIPPTVGQTENMPECVYKGLFYFFSLFVYFNGFVSLFYLSLLFFNDINNMKTKRLNCVHITVSFSFSCFL